MVLIPKRAANPPGLNGRTKYRPICLLDDVGKGLECVIAGRMKEFMEEREVALSDKQFGFREGKSTIEAMLAVRNFVEDAVAEG